jgi:hypothetical protein
MIRNHLPRWVLATLYVLGLGCASGSAPHTPTTTLQHPDAHLAQVYFWRARPGMLDAYNKYIREVAEPIDHEAQRAGAFLAVTTYAVNDTTLPYTHMRVFLLRDSAQLRGLGAALSAAGAKLEPDSTRRRIQGEYSATLRDRVGGTVMEIVR